MLVLRHRLAIAGVITATAIAVPAAALASGPGAPSGKPAPPQASAASASKSAAAASFGAPSGKPAPATGPVKEPSQVKKEGQPDQPPAPVRAFAARLGVSTDAAGRAFKQILGLSSQNGVDPASPAFAAIAREVGVSPAQLATAWNAVR
jgi:hypothetical protein